MKSFVSAQFLVIKPNYRPWWQAGKIRPDFDVKKEAELFYGFIRKNDTWHSVSCTLNSWVKPVSGIWVFSDYHKETRDSKKRESSPWKYLRPKNHTLSGVDCVLSFDIDVPHIWKRFQFGLPSILFKFPPPNNYLPFILNTYMFQSVSGWSNKITLCILCFHDKIIGNCT